MKKTTTLFICSNCDAQSQKWTGRCLECGKWGSVTEVSNSELKTPKSKLATHNVPLLKSEKLTEIKGENVSRTKTGINELDRVLGGGLVPGSFVLLGGEPGIGKSTLALQLATSIDSTLYVSGEESIEQIKLRSDRLKVDGSELQVANATNIESIISTIQKNKPKLAIIDSIQTIYSDEVEGGPGSPNQIRASGAKLMGTAKDSGVSIVLIGHITKDGSIAGPKTLEHLVDTVLYFEGDQHHNLRILRATKNRFGSTDEVGVFDMTATGLQEVGNPSEMFLEERGEDVPGSVVTCLIEGSRAILVEVQALVNKTVFGYPVRKASGFDLNRLHVLIAVLQKRAGVDLGQYDVHINIVGGVKATEPAADLAVALAIASAYKDKALGKDLAVFGEVGLGGEVRSVRQSEKRIKECENLGIKRVVTHNSKLIIPNSKLKLIDVKNIQELIKQT
jgi:DNA repair protein RadA/Sms